ncbi:GAF domain-containing protein [Caballeronia sp. SEWSISQ10-4 2]|uniref:GAF domain-containing protein n=1 Tax=Caballeronia sp. SEWSISQ10-4 2 TaxID=2937438 RepID=UPI00264DD1F4|nr:GAF domain-containing protein [Caballeronia sp. SEWSISQ10-4 2]MDN7180490.1 GAF domain-containing protein [Caballeronia sp. SEWSISQ10-4 2]
MFSASPITAITSLAYSLHCGEAPDVFWKNLERTLQDAFGHRLFTVLAYDPQSRLLERVYSTRPDFNPVGGRKRVTKSMWTRHVLEDGKIFRGSTREDIKAVFSDYEVLWANGCESVLNIPVRKQGVTIGSLNLLDRAGQYNDALIELAYVFAQLSVIPLEASRTALQLLDNGSGKLEEV